MTEHQHTADVLNRAADLIEERGWAGFVNWPGAEKAWGEGAADSPLCLEGALCVSNGEGREGLYMSPAYTAIAAHLGRNPIPVGAPIKDTLWQWNDAHNRTAAEVIEVLRATAVIEQARADEHTATDTGYDTAAEMLAVAGDAAARTLAALR